MTPPSSASALRLDPAAELRLGFDGFAFEDLYAPEGLRRLSARFDAFLAERDAALAARFSAYRASEGAGLTPPQASELLISVSAHHAAFIARLFGIEAEVDALGKKIRGELPLFEFKREFIARRVFKKGAPERPTAAEFPSLDARVTLLFKLGFDRPSPSAAQPGFDSERLLAETVLGLLELERLYSGALAKTPEGAEKAPALREKWLQLRTALLSTAEGKDAFGSSLLPHGDDAEELKAVRNLLSLLNRWTFARSLAPRGEEAAPRPGDPRAPEEPELRPARRARSCPSRRPSPRRSRGPSTTAAPRRLRAHRPARHPRQVRSRSTTASTATSATRTRARRASSRNKTPRARRQEEPARRPARRLPARREDQRDARDAAKGDALGALAIVCVDNPMCPGTGHRICNDCMKACVFQKQEPVNIPQIETRVAHRRARAAVGLRDLRPAHALEPARRAPAVSRSRTTARTCSSSASAPRATRSRTTSLARASASSASTGSRSSRSPTSSSARNGAQARADPRLPRHHSTRSSTSACSSASAASASTASPFAGTRTSSRSSTSRSRGGANFRIYGGIRFGGTLDPRRRVAARLRPRRDRRGRGQADDHRHEEQPHRAASARRRDFLMALQLDRRLQEGRAREPAGAAPGGRDRRRPHRASTPRPSCSRTTRCRSRSSLARLESSARRTARGRRLRAVRRRGAGPAPEFLEHGRACRARARAGEGRRRGAELHTAARQLGRRLARLPRARSPSRPRTA